MTALYHLFPPTLHPMVIHFTIAIIYLTALCGILGMVFRSSDFYYRAFFGLLVLSILATLAAGAAGVVSESYIHVPHDVHAMLHNHKKYGELTGVFIVIATALQWIHQRRKRSISMLALLSCLIAVALVSLTGFIGGSMVYDYGLGVKTQPIVSTQPQ